MQALHDLPAPAKLNLFLHVLGRRDDGYHLLQSAFVLIDWCDTLHLERLPDGRIERVDLTAALPADDLCLRAARALQAASGTVHGARISIDKQVPWGAGLGGGSSDAATVLIGLNRLWGLNWPRNRLMALGLTLGADVPFFIGGRNAWVEGIGEQITPIDIAPGRYAVIKPAESVATAAVFASPLLLRNTQPAIVADFLAQPNSFDPLFGANDLQAAALALSEEIPQALRLLSDTFGHARMSGSGSAVFAHAGPVSTSEAAANSASWPPSLPTNWTARWCHGLTEHPLRAWLNSGSAES
ncbi:MAG: 4-(cytidine 5'-diphospho)-2-C-methyl-D-erythritol kinase [Leptothrix sp. (in: b-proteobacteria)]